MKRLFVLLIAILALSPAFAAQISVNAAVNKQQISTAERLEYVITISSDQRIQIPEPPAPQIPNFSFVNMSSSSRSSSSIVNFKRENSYSRSFHYYYIPNGVGDSKIAAQKIKIDNKVYTTPQIDIQVVKASSSSPSQASPPSSGFGRGYTENYWADPSRIQGETLLLAELERQQGYVGQAIVVSYYLYTDQMVRSFNLDDEKDFPGYGKITFEQPRALDYEVVNYQGQRFQRALIKRLALLPNQAGNLQIPQLKGRARIYEFGYLNKNLSSELKHIAIKALPVAGQPPDFSGAIGDFKVSETLSSQEISLGEAITFSLRIAGRGNFNQFVNPVFKDDKAQISSPVAVDKLQAGIEGSRSLYYTIIPRDKGSYILPKLSFSWFNPATGSYEYYQSQPHEITVKSANVMSYFSGLWEGSGPKTINPMFARPFYPNYKSPLSRPWYWLLVALILGTMAIAAYIAIGKKQQHTDPASYYKRRAERNFRRYLGEATQSAKSGSADFYQMAERGFNQFLSDKYNIAKGLSNPEKLAALAEKGIDPEAIQASADFWETCNRARFSPEEISSLKISEDLLQLRQLVDSFSKNNRRRK